MKRLIGVPAAVLLFFVLFSGCRMQASCRAPAGTPAGTPESKRVPVLMYHSILKDPARQGRYIVSPDVLRADLAYLAQNGYESVFVSELAAFVREGTPLPEKPVLITFDDGHYNNLTYVLPLLRETGNKALVSVVGAYCQKYQQQPDPNPNYAYLSWDEVRQLAESGVFEIGCHSYDLHAEDARQGAGRKWGESDEAYREVLTRDTEKALALLWDGAGIVPCAYAYPFGIVAEGSGEVLSALGFGCTFSCRERVNVITQGRPESLLCLGRFNRPAGIATEDFMARALG